MRFKTASVLILISIAAVFSQNAAPPSHLKKVWVFFTDKPDAGITNGKNISSHMSERCIARRSRSAPGGQIVRKTDIPVATDYLRGLEDQGIQIIGESRWLNAVTAYVNEAERNRISALPYVRNVQNVRALTRSPLLYDSSVNKNQERSKAHELDYGLSYTQSDLIRIPEIHDLGFSGKNILIGLIDTGFSHESPSVVAGITVAAEYDFHWNDPNTANESNDSASQDNHGTAVLSVIGGYEEGELIGPAYNAQFALAKSEWEPTETRIEEDDWVRAIEWLEALGADIVSSSLGYRYFDEDGWGYEADDMDGNTCVTTIAADIAASLGIVVCVSSGNYRGDGWNIIVSPADGDSVMAIGAVSSNGKKATFSLGGPTADGRIKPDFMAMGTGVYAYSPQNGGYVFASGTSFAAPLVAGACALILEARPELTPMQVREALRATASNSAAPDNELGWGIIDAYDALFHHGMVFTGFNRLLLPLEQRQRVEVDIYSRTGVNPDSVRFIYRIPPHESVSSVILAYKGGMNPYRFYADFPIEMRVDSMFFTFEARDDNGDLSIAPVGAPEKQYSFSGSSQVPINDDNDIPDTPVLLQNYPNPFNNDTTIQFSIKTRTNIKITIYDALGRIVITLYDGIVDGGQGELTWTGKDADGLKVPSGLYFCALEAESREIIKLIMLK